MDRATQGLCPDSNPSYVLWASPDALPRRPLLLTTLPHPGGPNAFTPADSLRLAEWPPSLHRGRFRLLEDSKASDYTAYAYPGTEDAFLVAVEGTALGGDESPPIEVRYQAWFFALGDRITPLFDNNAGGGCGPEQVDLQGALDLTGDGDHDLVFGPSLMVLERHRDGFRTRAAPRLPCRC